MSHGLRHGPSAAEHNQDYATICAAPVIMFFIISVAWAINVRVVTRGGFIFTRGVNGDTARSCLPGLIDLVKSTAALPKTSATSVIAAVSVVLP
jgi:hypothetical protein